MIEAVLAWRLLCSFDFLTTLHKVIIIVLFKVKF